MYRSNFLDRVVFVWLIFLATCTPKPSPIITNANCSPPCWHNITPGQTTVEELEIILNNSPLFIPDRIAYRRRYEGYRNYFHSTLSTEDDIVIALLEGTVSRIYLSSINNKLVLGITFEEAIIAFGEPDYIYSFIGHGFRKTFGIIFGPYSYYYVSAISPKKGIWFTISFPINDHYDVSNMKIELKPNNELVEIEFFDPQQFEILANKGRFSSGIHKYHELIKRFHPWEGYGDVEEKYPYIP